MKNKLKKFFRNFDLREGAASLMFLVLGILFIVFPEGMLKTLCYVAGALTLVWGIVRMILYFREEGGVHVYDVVILAAVMVSGILLIVAPAFVSEFITVMLGVLLILDSISKIIESRELYKLNKGAEWLTAAIIGVVCAAGARPYGVAALIQPNRVIEGMGGIRQPIGLTGVGLNYLVELRVSGGVDAAADNLAHGVLPASLPRREYGGHLQRLLLAQRLCI